MDKWNIVFVALVLVLKASETINVHFGLIFNQNSASLLIIIFAPSSELQGAWLQ